MAIKNDYQAGTVSITAGTTALVGAGGANWLGADIQPGDTFLVQNLVAVVAAVVDATHITLASNWTGTTLAAAPYRIRYQPDGSRYSAAVKDLVETLGNGNVQALAGLTGSLNKLPRFTGAGAMDLVDQSELTRGVEYDVQVDDIAARAAYDGQAAGYAVLVSDVGDGRSALYVKASNSLADWSDPAFLTGPPGGLSSIEVGTVTTLAPGAPATVVNSGTDQEPVLDFGIPAGNDGTMTGPVSSATDNLPTFSNTTGATLKDSGFSVARVLTLPRFVDGLIFKNNSTISSTTHLDLSPGACVSFASTRRLMVLATAMTKRIDQPWTAGHNNGGRMSAAAVANTSYHKYLIYNPTTNVTDWGFDVSATAPTLPSGFTDYCRIGSIPREGGALLQIRHFGNTYKRPPFLAIGGTTGYAALLTYMGVPTGIVVQPLFTTRFQTDVGATGSVLAGDAALGGLEANIVGAKGSASTARGDIFTPGGLFTNSSGQIYTSMAIAGTCSLFDINCIGWIDFNRGIA